MFNKYLTKQSKLTNKKVQICSNLGGAPSNEPGVEAHVPDVVLTADPRQKTLHSETVPAMWATTILALFCYK